MDWRSAFLVQATSDYQVAVLLSESENVPLCHTLHYLQMSLEKLSKGIMAIQGSMDEPPHSHAGATRLIQYLKQKNPITKPFHQNLSMAKAQREMYIKELLPTIQFIEQIAPALATNSGTKVNAEYPWPSPSASGKIENIIAPINYEFTAICTKTKLPKLLQLIGTIVKSYPA